MQCAFCEPSNVRGKELLRRFGALATSRTLMCALKSSCAGQLCKQRNATMALPGSHSSARHCQVS